MIEKNINEIIDELLDYITFESKQYDLFDIVSFKRKDDVNRKESDFVYNPKLQEELKNHGFDEEDIEGIQKYLTPLENRTNFIGDFVEKQLNKIDEDKRQTDSFCWATELVLRIYEQKLNNKPEQLEQITNLRKKVVNYEENEFNELFNSTPNNVPNWESNNLDKTKNAITDMFINFRTELEKQNISQRKIKKKEKELYKTLDKWKVLGRENQVQELYNTIYAEENESKPISWRKKAALVGLAGITSFLLFPIKTTYEINRDKQYTTLKEITEQRDYASLEGNVLTINEINISLEDEDVSTMTNILKNSEVYYKTMRKIGNYFSKKIKLNEENKNEK